MSNCDVCIGGSYDDGFPEFSRLEKVKARKNHQCCECRTIIHRGSLYERYSGKFDGDLFAEKTCLPCADVAITYSCGNVRPCSGELWELIREQFPGLKMAGECWDSLSAPGKAKLLEEWQKWKGLV